MRQASSIPIISLYGNLIVSIQTALSDESVRLLKDDLTQTIEEQDSRGLIVDISGVDVLDSYISRAIRDIGMVARLMGTDTIICGLDPTLAITLVEMGLDLEGVSTALNLEMALEQLLELQADGGPRLRELTVNPDSRSE